MPAKVKGGTLNMRSGPSTASRRKMGIPDGTAVAVLEKGDEWCKISYDNEIGYVMTKYLDFGNTKDTGFDVVIHCTSEAERDMVLK